MLIILQCTYETVYTIISHNNIQHQKHWFNSEVIHKISLIKSVIVWKRTVQCRTKIKQTSNEKYIDRISYSFVATKSFKQYDCYFVHQSNWSVTCFHISSFSLDISNICDCPTSICVPHSLAYANVHLSTPGSSLTFFHFENGHLQQ